MTTARPQNDKNDKRQKRHLFVYIVQRTLLKIFQRVRDEARKIFLKKLNIFLVYVKFNTYICKCKFQLIINLIKSKKYGKCN